MRRLVGARSRKARHHALMAMFTAEVQATPAGRDAFRAMLSWNQSITAIIIDARKRQVRQTRLELDATFESAAPGLMRLFRPAGAELAMSLGGGHSLAVFEDVHRWPHKDAWGFCFAGSRFVGDGLVLRHKSNGAATNCDLAVEQVAKHVEWLSPADARGRIDQILRSKVVVMAL
jgi:hypothetical protein